MNLGLNKYQWEYNGILLPYTRDIIWILMVPFGKRQHNYGTS